jgi:xylulokinase
MLFRRLAERHDMQYVIGYDLGTGGIKASLYNEQGFPVSSFFEAYPTYFPNAGWHEQHPSDWWSGVCHSTRLLLEKSGIPADRVLAVALCGQSLVAVPIDEHGKQLLDSVPIWSDTRAVEETREFFRYTSYDRWYMTTGNGDSSETYTIMKLMRLKNNLPEIWARTRAVLGCKDYINYRLTGNMATDYSYASGSGVFDLLAWRYSDEYLENAGVSRSLFPEPVESHAIIGRVSGVAAEETGLAEGTPVACGGVDNAVMALGAQGIGDGRVYTSLGSSSWIAVTAKEPVLDLKARPFIFACAEKGYYTSGVSIFSAGNAYRWARDQLCRDLSGTQDDFKRMDEMAQSVPVGANGIMFNPTLAGASPQEPGRSLRGSFCGITLSTTREELLRAVLEGVALSLRVYCLDALKIQVHLNDTMLLCGGGARSSLWRQIIADIFDMKIMKTNVDQDTATLGSAAIALRGAGLIDSYDMIESCHGDPIYCTPDPATAAQCQRLQENFKLWSKGLSGLHDQMETVRN